MSAYAVKGYQINGPKWLDSERFDIVAKIPKGATKEQFQLMLQNLLAERFKLTLHHETKELPMYALVVGKGGHKLKESVEDDAAAGAAPQGGAAGDAPPPPPGAGYGGAPVMGRMKVGADGMPQLPANMGKNNMMVMMMNGRMRLVANHRPITALLEMLSGQLGFPALTSCGVAKLPANMGKNNMMVMMMNGRMRLVANHRPITALLEMLSGQLGFPVVAATRS